MEIYPYDSGNYKTTITQLQVLIVKLNELVANLPVAYLPSGKSATGKLDTANLLRKPLCRQNKNSLPGKLTLKLKRQI